MPILLPPSEPAPPAAPVWWPLLTDAMRRELLGWLRVRKIDTSAWPK